MAEVALVNLTIDDKKITVPKGTTILNAALQHGTKIPHLCYHPKTGQAALCRVCVVEVEGMKGLQTACSVPVKEDMVVHATTERTLAVRRMIVELLLSNGHHNCISCERNGRCELQDAAYLLGIETPSYPIDDKKLPLDESSPGIVYDPNKCIQCFRCIKGCNNVVVNRVLEMGWRSNHSVVICDDDKPMGESTCVQCGECVQLCPVGALTEKQAIGKGRSYEMTKVQTTCPYCGVGCQMELHVKDNQIVRVYGVEGDTDNEGSLCVKGRFGLDFVSSPNRLTKPLLRKNGKLEEVSWEEALDFTANKLLELKNKYGSNAIAGLCSAKCTNEENYVFQKFMRAVIKTNNVDHCARLCHSATVAGLAATLGSGAMTNSMREFKDAEMFFIIGSNTTESHPVIAYYVKQAVAKGAKLIIADPRRIDLVDHATYWLQQRNGTDIALLNGMMNVIITEGLEDREYIQTRTENYEAFKENILKYDPDRVEKITGVPAELIRQAAIEYAKADKAALLYCMGITQHITGTNNVKSCVNLQLLTGNIGKYAAGINPLRGQSNVQGACDMGGLVNVFPAYQPVTNPDVRKKFEDFWGVENLDDKIGLTVVEMFNAADEGKVKAIYIMGENPVLSDPNSNHIVQAIKNLELFIVQDIMLTETAQLATVVFPAPSFAEKDGTITNTSRRVQRIRKAIEPPGVVRQDYDIIHELAKRMGYPNLSPGTAEQIFEEIRKCTPSYAGITYQRLEQGGIQWPCPNEEHSGTAILHKEKFVRGLALFSICEHLEPAELPDKEYPFILSTGRILYQYHTASMSGNSQVLNEKAPDNYIEIHPKDAARLNIKGGELVKVRSRRGEIKLKALISNRPFKGSVFIPWHYADSAANILTIDALDPIAKIPEYKVAAVAIEKA